MLQRFAQFDPYRERFDHYTDITLKSSYLSKEQITMNKIIAALSMIFCKSLITRILPHLFKAEATKQPGPLKREVATRTIIIMISEKPSDFDMPEMNPSVPWPELIPILVDTIIRVLNLLFGKNWLSNSNPPIELPEHGSPQEPGPAPNPRS